MFSTWMNTDDRQTDGRNDEWMETITITSSLEHEGQKI